jgi:hypothetical protein
MAAKGHETIYEGLEELTAALERQPTDGLPLGYTMRSWNCKEAPDREAWRHYVRLHKALGYSNISLDIPWGEVEATPGEYDFSLYGPAAEIVAEEGMTLQIKLNTRNIPAHWKRENLLVRGPDGPPERGEFHTFADEAMNAAMAGFYRATAERMQGLGNLFYCSALAASFECEYHHSVWTDFGEPARRQMAAWLEERYGSLRRLEESWSRKVGTWQDAALSWRGTETIRDGRPDAAFVDFMKHRESSIALWLKTVLASLRAGDPSAQYGPQVGRIVGSMAPRRGTPGVFSWASPCEWIFIDPSPADDMEWEVAVELDGPYMFDRLGLADRMQEIYVRHARQAYEAGAGYVCLANWSSLEQYRENLAMFEALARTKMSVAPRPAADDAVYVSKWDVYLFGAAAGHSLEGGKAMFRELRNAGKPVDVLLDDPILLGAQRPPDYKRIHVCGATVADAAVWERLKASGVELLADASAVVTDEYGRQLG